MACFFPFLLTLCGSEQIDEVHPRNLTSGDANDHRTPVSYLRRYGFTTKALMNYSTPMALAIATLVTGLTSSAQAQTTDYNPSWYVYPSVTVVQPDTQVGPDQNTNGLGLRFGVPTSPTWDVQMGVTATRASDTIPRARQMTLGVDGLYMFSRSNVRPFLLIGTGVQRDEIEQASGNTAQNAAFLSAGLGLQMGINDQWGVQLDYRRNHSYPDGNTLGMDRSNTNNLNFGLIYTFEKPAPARRVSYEEPRSVPMAAAAPQPAPYVAPVPVPVPAAVPAPRFERYTLSATELFGFDSAQVHMPQPKLDEIAAALDVNREVSAVQITGYTDRLGSPKYNQALSERRAVAVKNYLVDKGVDAGRINAMGKGEANPVVQCTDKNRTALIKCLESNRRVEIEDITVQRRVQ